MGDIFPGYPNIWIFTAMLKQFFKDFADNARFYSPISDGSKKGVTLDQACSVPILASPQNTFALRAPKITALVLMLAGGVAILLTFWLGSRYPGLLQKAQGLSTYESPSFIYTSVLMKIADNAGFWEKTLATFVNWCWSMRIGMTFGLTFGALLHTYLRYFPLRTSNSIYLNTLKGIILGAPAGVCVNCAVPVACGITRGRSKVELALGFMLGSPSLNVIVVAMILSAFPWQFAAVHFSLIAVVLLIILPLLVKYIHGTAPAPSAAIYDLALPDRPTAQEVLKTYGLNLWKLFRTAVPMMLVAAIFSALAVQFIPFDRIFADAGFFTIALVSFITTLLPAPIAMEVMVAHHLYSTKVAAPFVMVFLSTLGSYSILPMIYLWREVSRKIAVALYLAFATLGIVAAYIVMWLL
ncbi:MAG: permease [Alphaproteobacteria bacterium]|nr:permease [Alphaproteobacteria bacterium]